MINKIGKATKDSGYLKRIKVNTAEIKNHPVNEGVKIQAHHLISAEAMKRSGLGSKIEKFGYNINLLPNLVFIPCTLQGACYLKLQPHRGNHNSVIAKEDDYDDDLHPETYHDFVARRILDLDLPLAKECKGIKDTRINIIASKLNNLSADIVDFIQKQPNKLPLTSIAKHFSAKSKVGCSNVDSVTSHRNHALCSVERNHLNKQNQGQSSENIIYDMVKPYTLKPGE